MKKINESTEDEEGSLMLEKPLSIKMEKEKETFAKIVWVRIEFIAFGEVDTFNEKYQAEVKIRAKWYDEDIDTYDKNKNWYPKLYIENAMHDVKEEFNYKVDRLEGNKVMITETRVSKGSFWER